MLGIGSRENQILDCWSESEGDKHHYHHHNAGRKHTLQILYRTTNGEQHHCHSAKQKGGVYLIDIQRITLCRHSGNNSHQQHRCRTYHDRQTMTPQCLHDGCHTHQRKDLLGIQHSLGRRAYSNKNRGNDHRHRQHKPLQAIQKKLPNRWAIV